MSIAHARLDWDTMDCAGTSRYEVDRIHNANPEAVAEAVLDACSDLPRGYDPFGNTSGRKADGSPAEDYKFRRRAMHAFLVKLRTLASMAQADPVKSQAFYNVLDTAHSCREKHVPYEYKNGVRVERKCMGCGREEKNCTTALSLAGPYNYKSFSSTVDHLFDAWYTFDDSYRVVMDDDFADQVTPGKLPDEDYGDYMLGECCLRKARLTLHAQTMIAHLMRLEAYSSLTGGFSPGDAGEQFLIHVRELELCIADEDRPLPEHYGWWDDIEIDFWEQIDEARSAAASGLQHNIPKLVGERAREKMRQSLVSEEQEEDDSSDENVYASDEDGVDKRRGYGVPYNDDEPVRRQRLRKARRAVLPEDEEESDEEVAVEDVGRHGKVCAGKPTRQSKRQRGCSPSPERALPPRKSKLRLPDRKPEKREKPEKPGVASLAKAQRIPGGALAARTEVLCELTKLKLRLMREGRADDAAICTAAMFTLEELMELNGPSK